MSPVTKVIRRPSSCRNEAPCEHTGPIDSNASGTKMWFCEISSYIASFLVDTASVTLPALCEDSPMYDDAMVFSTVTFQTTLLPVLQGIRERLSGRFPSFQDKPGDSLTHGMSARSSARAIRSFEVLCLACLPLPSLHDKPCKPSSSIIAPQGHKWGWQSAGPSRRPIATRMSSLSSLSPKDAIGKALSQSLLCATDTARRRALLCVSCDDWKM